MATLVLTVVGTAIGGPLGGAIGAIAGQQIDQNILFPPPDREGPRLKELDVQTSSYGTQVPKLFGKMRVAGTVIWATDLQESSSTDGGGKGQPDVTTYSYSASLAVALSSRPIQSVGRIWADGNLLRGVAGDFKVSTEFRLYTGHEDQPVDPLIAADTDVDATPAYRGLAYAVFENLDLTNSGNRIPSLTFEVIADSGAVGFETIAADCSPILAAENDLPLLQGYAAEGRDAVEALQSSASLLSLGLVAAGEGLAFYDRSEAVEQTAIGNGLAIVSANGEANARPNILAVAPGSVPKFAMLRYYDPDRDYQAGVQQSSRPGWGRETLRIDFPATLDAASARALIERRLRSQFRERDGLELHLPDAFAYLRPGSLVRFESSPGLWRSWRVTSWELLGNAIALNLSAFAESAIPVVVEAETGRHVAAIDAQAGITHFALLDLPFAMAQPNRAAETPQLAVFATGAGEGAGWRSAQIYHVNAADGLDLLGRTAGPAILGETLDTLAAGPSTCFDRINSVDIALEGPNHNLQSADSAGLAAGSNLALIGDELLQFASVTPLTGNSFRLTGLRRGLAGTENAMATHQVGEAFALIDPALLRMVDPPGLSAFQPVELAALGRGDAEPVHASLASVGRALIPWSPVHGRAVFRSDDSLQLLWTRRGRGAVEWLDGVDIALGEEREAYLVQVHDTATEALLDEWSPPVPEQYIPAVRLAEYRTGGVASLTVSVRQVGRHALSPACIFTVAI